MTATATTVPANAAPARRTAESVSIGTVAPLDAVESTSFDGANVHAAMPLLTSPLAWYAPTSVQLMPRQS